MAAVPQSARTRIQPPPARAPQVWRRTSPASHSRSMLVVASGLVLGEGLWSIIALLGAAAVHK